VGKLGKMGSSSTSSTFRERELLDAARSGDEDAFGRLVEPYRAELHAHCYRMLGSLHDAEDALQDALLRAWRGLAKVKEPGSLRAWLYKIATNTSLDAIARRPKRVLPIDYGRAVDPHEGLGMPVVESVWLEPYPDETLGVEDGLAAPEARFERRESLELAFVAALQLLPPAQRAALILREVLGYSAKEVAATLETTVASVNSALQRARKTIDDKLPERSQQETLRAIGDERLTEIVEAYMDALARGDVPRVVSLLAEDAAWSMPPLPSWFRGTDGITGFLRFGPLSGTWRWKHVPARVNGQAAVGVYQWDEAEGAYLPFAFDVLTFEGERIKQVTAFITRSVEGTEKDFYTNWPAQPLARSQFIFERFGLPARLD
jgi:RNA polymerase sigma-70 factor, ECF subfamily